MSTFAGTLALTRLALRRDRVLLPVWIAVVVYTAVFSAQATLDLYPTLASREQAASAINAVPSLVALYGWIWDPSSLGALATVKLAAFGASLIGVLAIMLVIRHTRREEENGRFELLGATVVGRRAPLAAALIVSIGAMIVIGLLTAIGQTAVGLPAQGSWVFGMAWTAVGTAFAGVAAVTAQLTVSARAAVGWAVAVLTTAYVLRAMGDTSGRIDGSGWPSWLSPIGWGQQARAYAGDVWWPLILSIAFTCLAVVAAYALSDRRDLGAGLLPDRRGPAQASARLSTPLGLAWRLQRGLLLGWVVGYALLGLVLGNIASSVGDMLGSEQVQDFIQTLGGTQVLVDAFLALEFGFLGFFTAAYGVSAAMRLRSEEDSGHAELLLSTATSRTRWLASHLLVALAGTSLLCLVGGGATAVAVALQGGEVSDAGTVMTGVLVYLPAIWVLTGVVVLLVGVAPRLAALAWGVLVALLLLGELGPLLELPEWAMNVSPFAHVPRIPGHAMDWTPVLLLTVLAAGLMAVGAAGLRRRDIEGA